MPHPRPKTCRIPLSPVITYQFSARSNVLLSWPDVCVHDTYTAVTLGGSVGRRGRGWTGRVGRVGHGRMIDCQSTVYRALGLARRAAGSEGPGCPDRVAASRVGSRSSGWMAAV